MSARRASRRAVWRRRRIWPWLAAALALLAVGGWAAARLLAAPRVPPPPVVLEPPPAAPVPVVLAQGGETLEGVVLGTGGQPVAGAQIALAPTDAEGPSGEACPGGETALLLCEHPASAERLAEALAAGAGAAFPTVQSDQAGRFRFAHLRPGTFQLAASAPESWAAVERAQSGVPLRLVLTPVRTLQGRAVDEHGQPVASARVRLVTAGPGPVHEAVTASDGTFHIGGARRAPFTVLVDAAGFLPSVAHPTSPDAGTVRLARPRQLTLHVAGAVDGPFIARVRSVSRPLLAAGPPVVHLVREVEMKEGSATFHDLPPGEVEVDVLGPSLHGGPEPVVLRDLVTQVSLRLSPSAAATVAVVDAQGRPVHDCVLQLVVPGGLPRQTAAASCETVELDPAPPGEYILTAEAPGFRRSERPVHLGAGPVSLEVLLEPGVALSGRVVDAAGVPVAGVSLVVSPIGAVTRSDRSGTFRVSVPSPGLYSVEAQDSELGGAERTVAAPDTDVVLRLQPRSVLDLEVLVGGRPLEGAQAVLFDVHDTGPGGQYQADRATGPDGRVRLLGFPPGTYLLGVMHPQAGSAPKQEVVLREGTPAAVTLRLPPIPSGAIAGRVADAFGRAVKDATVAARPPDAPPATSDAEGRFRIGGLRADAEYRVTASRGGSEPETVSARAGETSVELRLRPGRTYRGRVVDPAGHPVRSFRIGGVDVASDDGRFAVPLQVRGEYVALIVEAPPSLAVAMTYPASRVDLGDIELRPPSPVQGVVREPDGRPVSDALVICEGCRGEPLGEEGARVMARTDAAGRFSMPSISTHTWVGLVAMKDARRAWAQAGRGGEEVTLTLEEPVAVRGRVLGTTGAPAAGVAVVFSELLREPAFAPVTLVTGADGTFSGLLRRGTYWVTVSPDTSGSHQRWGVGVPPQPDGPLEFRLGLGR